MARRRSLDDMLNPELDDVGYVRALRAMQEQQLRNLKYLTEIEDRRLWDPEGPDRSPRTSVVGPSGGRLRVAPSRPRSPRLYSPTTMINAGVSFLNGRELAVCLRRKVRREVLHALRQKPKGGGGSRKRNWMSNISCK